MVGVLKRDTHMKITLLGYANKLLALAASARLPKTKPNNCVHLLIITDLDEVVQEIEFVSSNK